MTLLALRALGVVEPAPAAWWRNACCRKTQCDISAGTVIDSSMPRVTPPRTNSRRREWP